MPVQNTSAYIILELYPALAVIIVYPLTHRDRHLGFAHHPGRAILSVSLVWMNIFLIYDYK